jgi:hypothetical protein
MTREEAVAQQTAWELVNEYLAARDEPTITSPSGGDRADHEMALVEWIAKALFEAAGQWQPIETAPKDGTEIILFWPSLESYDGKSSEPRRGVGKWCAPAGYFTEHWALDGRWTPGDDPTHWRPLPTPPSGGEG